VSTEEIEVRIDKTGRVAVTVLGTKGPDCTKRTESLIEVLGGEIEEHIQSEEYLAEPIVEQQRQQLG
jgi:hypothetical protein